jgi:hypothetical protein
MTGIGKRCTVEEIDVPKPARLQFNEIDSKSGIVTWTSAHEHFPDLESILLGHFKEITGIYVGLKIKSEKPNPKPKLADIDKEWAKIKPISNQRSFEKVRHGVFTINIERGAEFLGESIY